MIEMFINLLEKNNLFIIYILNYFLFKKIENQDITLI